MAKAAPHEPKPVALSVALQRWLKTSQPKTLQNLSNLFAEKSFAVIFLVLMALPALPIPTGGITHVTELVTMLLCLQLIVGRSVVWLPQKWLNIDVSKFLQGKAATKFLSVITWFERFSRQRGAAVLTHTLTLALVGVVVLLFTIAAFVAPPFSGLDTLPALGVVIISLGLILEDGLIVLIGLAVGAAGIGLEIAAGEALYHGARHLLF